MGKTRLFREDELKSLGQRTLDLLQSSIEAGDGETAAKLAQRMYNEFLGMHDLYRDWVTHLLTFIGKRFGDEVLAEALEETVAGYTKRLADRYVDKPTKRRLEILLGGFRGHLQPFDIEEDDEKFTITPRPCGSGQRQIESGGYDPPSNFLKIGRAQPMTFGQADFPVYCVHCFFQNQTLTEPGGKPLFVTEPSSEPGKKPCKIYVYK